MGGVKEELVARLDLAIHEDDATMSCKPDESSRKRQSGCTRGVMELRCVELEEKINRKRQKKSAKFKPLTSSYGARLYHLRLRPSSPTVAGAGEVQERDVVITPTSEP